MNFFVREFRRGCCTYCLSFVRLITRFLSRDLNLGFFLGVEAASPLPFVCLFVLVVAFQALARVVLHAVLYGKYTFYYNFTIFSY